MNQDPPNVEAALHQLQAAPLDEGLLARLEASAEGTWTELTHEEMRLENWLRQSTPASLTPDFLTDLESITRGVHFPVNEKILLFPNGATTTPRRTRRPRWATAAAVALIGAATALLMPTQPLAKTAKTSAAAPHQSSPPLPADAPQNFVPATYNRGLTAVHDEGVIWSSNNEPQRVVRVIYKECITLKDADGRTLEVEQPRVEYLLVPDKTD